MRVTMELTDHVTLHCDSETLRATVVEHASGVPYRVHTTTVAEVLEVLRAKRAAMTTTPEAPDADA